MKENLIMEVKQENNNALSETGTCEKKIKQN